VTCITPERGGARRLPADLNIGPQGLVVTAMEVPEDRGQNLEIARRSFAAFNRNIAEGADVFYEFLDAGIEWIPITALLDGRSYHGPEGVCRWMDDLKRHWEFYEIRWNEGLDLAYGRVLAFGTWRARGRRGGVQLIVGQAAWLIHLRGGKLTRLQTFTDRSKALEAAGLRE